MILHETDYSRIRVTLINLKGRCDRLRRRVADPRVSEAAMIEVRQVEKRIEELTEQMNTYLELMRRLRPVEEPLLLIDVPEKLIQRRISLGWSQGDLARAIGQNREVVVRYERTLFASVSLKRLVHIDQKLLVEEVRRRSNDGTSVESSRF